VYNIIESDKLRVYLIDLPYTLPYQRPVLAKEELKEDLLNPPLDSTCCCFRPCRVNDTQSDSMSCHSSVVIRKASRLINRLHWSLIRQMAFSEQFTKSMLQH